MLSFALWKIKLDDALHGAGGLKTPQKRTALELCFVGKRLKAKVPARSTAEAQGHIGNGAATTIACVVG